MAANTTSRGMLLVSSQSGPLASLEQAVHDRWTAYLHSCAETLPVDEKFAVYSKLYAAVARLNESVPEGTVAEAILEIGSNLMACEQMAVVVLQKDTTAFSIMRSVGLQSKRLETVRKKTEKIAAEVPEGEIYVKGLSKLTCPGLSSLGITACAPLSHNNKTKGAIVFFDFLPQRNGLNAGDHALVKLLSIYAGPSLFEF